MDGQKKSRIRILDFVEKFEKTDSESEKEESLPKRDERSKNWCFTLNNWTEDEYKEIVEEFATVENTRYLIIGKEGKRRTPHLQGYVELKNARRWTTLTKFNKRIHWETRRKSPQAAADYCKKEGDFEEWGDLPKQGKRSDLEVIGKLFEDGLKIKDVAMQFPAQYIRYHKGMEKLYELHQEPRKEKPICVWLSGKAGLGKTEYALRKHGEENVFIKDEAKWWGTYDHQEAILIDDFDPIEWNYRRFLRLLDKNRYEGETKGGHIQFNSKYIYISCEFPPEHFWRGNELEQVLGRFTEIIELHGTSKRSKPKRRIVNVDEEEI